MPVTVAEAGGAALVVALAMIPRAAAPMAKRITRCDP
jgi:hypothetical protein